MNLLDGLRATAERRSGHGVSILRRDRKPATVMCYEELYQAAGRLAARLADRGVAPDDRVAVVLPTSLDFARAFFGVLAAGAVAVPLPGPPRIGSPQAYLRRTAAAVQRSQVRTVLTTSSSVPLLTALHESGAVPVTVLDVRDALADETHFAPRTPSDDALIQYTSGSGGDPRGVVLSHGNLAAGVEAIARGTALSAYDIGCTWLPLFHDMGLIGSFLTPILHDAAIHLLTTDHFLWDPLGWLDAMSRLGATFTMAPDSGYRYLLRRVGPDLPAGLDLSRWRIAVNGAEPVDRRLQEAFVERFAAAGLAADIFLPAYGLAEATLAVTFPPLGQPARTLRAQRTALSRGQFVPVSRADAPHRELVSVGSPVAGVQVRLVDEEGRSVLEDRVGAIEVRGTPVSSQGYDRQPEQTREVLRADGWLATGDLGLQQDGELYIVGRIKETIIVFGANYWASDIEGVIRNIPDLPVHGVLAQQLHTDDRTGLGLVIETTERDASAQESISQRIRGELNAALGIFADQITYVRRGGISRTTSGKVVRSPLTTVQPIPVAHAEGSS